MNPELGSRALFPNLQATAYTNHAAISPPSALVRQAAETVLSAYAQKGVDAFFVYHERRDALRAQLGRLIGAKADDIAFVANTTRGLTDIALCMPWNAGERVLLTRGEFPANVTPWQRAAELFDLEIAWLPQPSAQNVRGEWLAALRAELERGVRLVALSAVQFQTGLRMPLEDVGRLCEKHGTELAVDSIQACGAVPVDVSRDGIHYLSNGSHKWLMGLEGIAFVYVAPSCAARLEPRVAGWLSHEDAVSFLSEGPGHLRYDRGFQSSARVLEGGMYNTLGCESLAASLGPILELGVDAIFDHIDTYNERLEERLLALGFGSHRAAERSLRSGSACFTPPKGVVVTELFEEIDTSVVSCAIPDGQLRFSPHWPNALDEVDLIATELKRALDRITARR